MCQESGRQNNLQLLLRCYCSNISPFGRGRLDAEVVKGAIRSRPFCGFGCLHETKERFRFKDNFFPPSLLIELSLLK